MLANVDLNREHVRWNADGSYTPYCERCGYEGKAQGTHAAAMGAARNHLVSVVHMTGRMARRAS